MIKKLLRDKNTTWQQLMNMLANGEVPKMKMAPVFAGKIKNGSKTKEFRKASKFNQTGGVAVMDMNSDGFLFFMFIRPEEFNPSIEMGRDYNTREFGYIAGIGDNNISEEEYDFIKERYVDKFDFVMFNIDKVVE